MGRTLTRRTQGAAQAVFVGKNIAETDDTTIANFIANAPTGEIGVFDANGAKHTDLITAAEKFQILQKMSDGSIKKTPLYNFSDLTARKTAYTAPTKWTAYLGWNGTGKSMNLAAAPGAGKVYELAVLELTEGNHPFPTWNYSYTAKAGDAEIDVALALAKQINDSTSVQYKQIEQPVQALPVANGTFGNFALTGTTPTLTFTLGSDVVTIGGTGGPTFDGAIGDLIAITDASGTATAANTYVYKITAVSAGVSVTLDRPFEGATRTLAEAQGEGTGAAGGSIKKLTAVTATGLKLTALNNAEHFKIARREEYENADETFSAYVRGNGTYAEVAQLELEGATFAGETTQYEKSAAKYGQNDRFADSAGTYQIYNFDITPQSDSKAGWGVGKVKTVRMAIAAHNSGSSFKTYMNTLFGV
jgi:hypothetical protein